MPHTSPRPGRTLSRRSLLGSVGLAAAAIGGLGACSGGPTADPGNGQAGGTGSAAPVSAKKSEIAVGSGTIFASGQAVITQPTAGEFRAFSSICTHARCPVANVTDTINCQCHGSKFSIADGSVVNGPATQPLPTRTVQVSGDTLSVA